MEIGKSRKTQDAKLRNRFDCKLVSLLWIYMYIYDTHNMSLKKYALLYIIQVLQQN